MPKRHLPHSRLLLCERLSVSRRCGEYIQALSCVAVPTSVLCEGPDGLPGGFPAFSPTWP